MDLEEFKMGYVIGYYRAKGNLFHNAIYRAQRDAGFSEEMAEMVHCEISGGEEHAVYAHPPRSTLIDITKSHKNQRYSLFRPNVYDLDPLERKRIKVAYISATYNNENYDWLGVLKFKFKFMFHLKYAKFCSEGCAMAIQHQFPEFYGGKPPYLFYPAHFGNPVFMHKVTEGVIE